MLATVRGWRGTGGGWPATCRRCGWLVELTCIVPVACFSRATCLTATSTLAARCQPLTTNSPDLARGQGGCLQVSRSTPITHYKYSVVQYNYILSICVLSCNLESIFVQITKQARKIHENQSKNVKILQFGYVFFDKVYEQNRNCLEPFSK